MPFMQALKQVASQLGLQSRMVGWSNHRSFWRQNAMRKRQREKIEKQKARKLAERLRGTHKKQKSK
jgi:hypothetical protein